MEEALDAFEVGAPVVLLGEWAGECVAGGIEVAGGDRAGAEDDAGGLIGDAGGELEADDGIKDGLDGTAVGEGERGLDEGMGWGCARRPRPAGVGGVCFDEVLGVGGVVAGAVDGIGWGAIAAGVSAAVEGDAADDVFSKVFLTGS